ncbi:YncE family protein [Parasphingorhabdus cellanae]|uniref:YncE family protein n=1 Tax=Parasphingorhabdus cellanae TaxID=2806553 RepID=A0ABX7T706_9SPHN|nr:YncE family protein [Parasphingorhabdus cellanae]QTD56688.1 YncE family protein [Parasphingorhabdus cellanae]
MKRFAIALISACLLAYGNASAEQSPPYKHHPAEILLVGNKGEDSLSFIDLKTGREVARRDTGKNPHEVAISPNGRLAAIVSYGAEHIDIFDIAAREKIETIALTPNKSPHGIVWLDDGRIIASTEGSDSIAIVSPPKGESQTREISQISTGQKGSHMVVVTPDKSRAFVSNMQSGTVSVLDLNNNRKITDLPAGTEPEGLAITPDGKTIWVADRRGDSLRIFDTRTFEELAILKTGKFPIRVAISPDGRTAVTSNYADGALGLFDVETRKSKGGITISGTVKAGQVTILFSPDGKRLYAAETGLNRIAEIDMVEGELIGRLAGGANGDGLGITGFVGAPEAD